MAYNSYNNGGYGQSNPYASQDPYSNSQSQSRYGGPPAYSSNNNAYRPSGDVSDVEMQPLNNNDPFGDANRAGTPQPSGDPNAILNDCREIGRAIDDLEGQLQALQRVQRGFLAGSGATNREVDATSAEIMSGYRSLGDRVKRIKSQPDARLPRNEPQVNSLDRRIKKAINQFQQTESAFRSEVQAQQRRQYQIVRPDATEAEIREATEAGGDTQIFQQALMNSDRRGQAQSTLRNVQQRHDAIQQIEKTMMELAQLFQDLDAIVVQQEPLVQNIEKHAEDTNTHMEQANVQLDGANKSARAARKKKWICLGLSIVILIVIIIIVIIVLHAVGVFNK